MTSERLDKQELALTLFRAGAIKFDFGEGFLLKDTSRSPVYVDLRVLRSFPAEMSRIVDIFYYSLLLSALGGQLPNLVADIPTSITPAVAVMSVKQDIPMITPRIDKKGHGSGAPIDGVFQIGMEVAIFDDVVTTAASKLEAITILEAAGLKIAGVFILVDREQGGLQQLHTAGYKAWAAITLPEILGILLAENKISQDEHDRVMTYLDERRRIQKDAAAAEAAKKST